MYSYVINNSDSENHFDKTYEITSLKNSLKNEMNAGTDKHAYRIKDLTEAINTSVLIDVDKKQIYNEWLTSDTTQFDASDEFVRICKEVGACDVY